MKGFGENLVKSIETALDELYDQGMVTVHVDLPLDDPGVLHVCETIRKIGLVFAGLMPRFHDDKDYLRMQKTTSGLSFDKIYAYSDVARDLKEIIVIELNERR